MDSIVCLRLKFATALFLLTGSLFVFCPVADAADPALDLFEQRIMPIFKSPKPSSCVQCHLASVDLKDYILPSHEQTFIALRDQGLIDVDNPAQSKILKLIEMGTKDPDKHAKLIHRRTRDAELAAFAAWIKACSTDEQLRAMSATSGVAARVGPTTTDRVIRHTRKDRLADSYERNVWSQRMRCFPCHTPNELDPSKPMHAKPIQRHRELVEKFGKRMDIFRETPAESMKALINSSRRHSDDHLPLINIDSPAESLLVLKPTNKLPKKKLDGTFEPPSYKLPVSHMGGLKMHKDDHSYKSFLAWIEDYARTVREEYTSDDQLPLDNWLATDIVLRLTNVPEQLENLTPLQLFVYRSADKRDTWQTEPIAFTQGLVTPRKIVNGSLFLLTQPNGSGNKEPKLAPGRYLIKVYADKTGRLKNDPTAMLPEDDYLGELELQARWRHGFKQAEIHSAAQLK
ncbi:MAG: hypothetical protein VB878_05390 [Pirellulaceae bacterium]